MTNGMRYLLGDIMVIGFTAGLLLIAVGAAIASPYMVGFGSCNLYWAAWAWWQHHRRTR